MKRWEEKCKKYKKSYYACLRKKRFLYIGMLVWIALRCFFRRFFTGLPRLARHRAVAYLCMAAVVSVLLFHASHSWTKADGNHLSLQIQQHINEVVEGYEDEISYAVMLVNDGEGPLTEVAMYLDGDPDFSLEPGDDMDGDTLEPDGRRNAALRLKPGKKAGKYYVTVVAKADELEEPVEQTIRVVVKEALPPEDTSSPEPTNSTGPTKSPKPTKSPPVTLAPKATLTPEVTLAPEATLAPEVSLTPEPTPASKATESQTPTKMPKVTISPKASPETSQSPLPSPSPEAGTGRSKSKTKQAAQEQQTEFSSVADEDIIRVTLPAHGRMNINPFAPDKSSQITSERLPVTNESDFPLNIEIAEVTLDIRQNASPIQKNCSLNIDIRKHDEVILAIRNLQEGANPLHYPFDLDKQDTAYVQFSGSVDAGTEHLWEDRDLTARMVFQFSKK